MLKASFAGPERVPEVEGISFVRSAVGLLENKLGQASNVAFPLHNSGGFWSQILTPVSSMVADSKTLKGQGEERKKVTVILGV